MTLVAGSPRIVADGNADPARGDVEWRPAKSIWIGSMTMIALVAAPATIGVGELIAFLSLTIITLCAGHSVGMHRKLIHNSFECPLWLEYILVYLGVLVGMAGPIGMMRQHDLRDWAQRQSSCHEYLCHRRGILLDYFWQCHCDIRLTAPPIFEPEERVASDPVYQWMERTWMAQQAPIALALFWLGGWSYVVWGVALRVAVSVTGHWLVGYFAHHDFEHGNEKMSWRVLGASVQGRDVPVAGLISMGESWHNNHHAFPGSAKIGLLPGQPDPGWWLISALKNANLATKVVLPTNLPERLELVRVSERGTGWSICHWRRRTWREVFGSAA